MRTIPSANQRFQERTLMEKEDLWKPPLFVVRWLIDPDTKKPIPPSPKKEPEMIAIVNVTKNLTEKGPHQYELRINRKVVTTFIHNREDDLSICLSKAAQAAYKAKPKDLLTKPSL